MGARVPIIMKYETPRQKRGSDGAFMGVGRMLQPHGEVGSAGRGQAGGIGAEFAARVPEFIAGVFAGVEPGAHGLGRITGAFIQLENGLVGHLVAVDRDSEDGRDQVGFVAVPDLDDVAIGAIFREVENVGAGRKDVSGDFQGLRGDDFGFLVPTIRAGTRTEYDAEQCGDEKELKRPYEFHTTYLPF